MNVIIVLRIALKALNRNKLRTGLTMLGMIIVQPGSMGFRGVQLGMGAATTLTTDDAEAIRRQVPGVFGEFVNATHVSSTAKVAVLGSIVRNELFGSGVDAVGQTVRIRNQIFRVIGVMAAKGPGAFGEDQAVSDVAEEIATVLMLRPTPHPHCRPVRGETELDPCA